MAKGCSSNNYEAARKQRLEENKKRFEDLGISTISKKLTEIASPAKKSTNRQFRPKSKTNDVVEPRRSSRARKPVPSYREEFGTDLPQLRKRSRSSSSSWRSYAYAARPLDEIKVATEQEKNRAKDAAKALLINLQTSNPSFIKSMVRSHVYSCFWLGLPSRFCEDHLPKTKKYSMVLEDEKGSEYDALYLGDRVGLSGGWRAFALEHKLDDGDALVFELVEAARFKIYIVRAFANIDEENMHTSKAMKESETVKPKEATRKTRSSQNKIQKISQVPTTPEPKSETVKPKEATKKTRSSQKKIQKISEVTTVIEPKEEAHLETVKPEAATKLPNKRRKSKEADVCEIGDTANAEKILLEENVAKTTETDLGKKKEPVQDDDNELKKVKPEEKASKPAAEKPRKKRAPKFFRKRD